MKLTLKVELREEPYNRVYIVDTDLYTVVMWERRFKRKASDMATGIGIEDLAFLAWEASRSNKVVVPVEFDSFVKRLIDVQVVENETEPEGTTVFTKPAPNAGN